MKKLLTSLFVLFLFSVVFAQATALTPNTVATAQTLTPTLSWTADATVPTHYRITVSTANPVVGGTGVYVTTVAVPTVSQAIPAATLANNSTYYWIVESSDDGGTTWVRSSNNAPPASFITVPVAPTLTTPADLAPGIALNTTFTWGAVAGGNFYELQVDATPWGAPEFAPAPGNYTTSPAATGLSNGVVYSWRVRASNDGGATYGDWSSTRTFTTILSAPVLTYPASSATAISITPNFTWNNVGGALTTYTLDISTEDGANFNANRVVTGAVPLNGGTDEFYLLPDANKLNNGAIYYWRVTPNAGTASEIRAFTTITAALPALYSPAHLSTIVGNVLAFQWSMPSSGLKYKIEISANPAFGTANIEAICPTGYFTTNSLSLPFAIGASSATNIPAGTYYWRIKSYTSSDVLISITNAWQFIIPGPPTAVPAYPINDQTVYTNSPQVYWYLNNYYYNSAVYYRVRWSTSSQLPAFWATLSNGTPSATTTGQYVTLPGLTAGSTYYYVVDATTALPFGTAPTTTISTQASFNVFYSSVTLNSIPIFLTYPAGGTTVYSTNPTLYWFLGMQIPGVTYDLEINPGTGFVAVAGGPFSGNEKQLTGLTAGTTYQWRVRINGATTYYGPETFTVHSSATSSSSSGPAIPTPASPIGGTVVSTQSPTLTWTVFSTSPLDYQVIWSTSPVLTGGVLTPSGSSGWLVTTSHTLSALTPGVTYYWQVRSRLSSTPATMSNYSTVGQFTVAAGASPVVVLPANPIVGSTINSSVANLSWIVPAQSSSTLSYDLEISKNKDLSGAQLISNLTRPSYIATNLEANKIYYWRVVSKTSGGVKSDYSYSGSFNSGSATAVEENEIPTQFQLTQNYPNPFNPTTVISYQLPTNSLVTLKIYDILGREVKSLVNQQMNAGKYNLNWNGDDNYGNKVASGTYIYRITADNFVSSKKMILIK